MARTTASRENIVANANERAYPLASSDEMYVCTVNRNRDIQNNVKKPCGALYHVETSSQVHRFIRLTRNSFVPDRSLVVSKWDLRGSKVTIARNFLDVFERNGLETYSVPSEVMKVPDCVGVAAKIVGFPGASSDTML